MERTTLGKFQGLREGTRWERRFWDYLCISSLVSLLLPTEGPSHSPVCVPWSVCCARVFNKEVCTQEGAAEKLSRSGIETERDLEISHSWISQSLSRWDIMITPFPLHPLMLSWVVNYAGGCFLEKSTNPMTNLSAGLICCLNIFPFLGITKALFIFLLITQGSWKHTWDFKTDCFSRVLTETVTKILLKK